jgi:hypothetical protein
LPQWAKYKYLELISAKSHNTGLDPARPHGDQQNPNERNWPETEEFYGANG